MPDIKMKPVMDKPKVLEKHHAPRNAEMMLKQQYKEREKKREPEDMGTVRYATDRVEVTERYGSMAAAKGTRHAVRRLSRKNNAEIARVANETPISETPCAEKCDTYPVNIKATFSRNASVVATHKDVADIPEVRRSMHSYAVKNTSLNSIPKGDVKKSKSHVLDFEYSNAPDVPKNKLYLKRDSRSTMAEHAAVQKARQVVQRSTQREMLKETVNNTKTAAKRMGRWIAQTAAAVGRAAAAASRSIVATGGGLVLLVVALMVAVIGGITASPFGLLFAGESTEAGAVPVSVAVAQLNNDLHTRLEALQTEDAYDEVTIQGEMADWVDVLAVFATKVAGSSGADAADVATLDADRIARLQTVFLDMNDITSTVETVYHSDSDSDAGWVEKILHITITPKSAADMSPIYHFTAQQTTAMDELLEQRELLQQLIGDLFHVSSDAAEVLKNLPEDLAPERRTVVEKACSLVGKVNYFWGGKSLTLGWDSQWGQLRKVAAKGSPSTGTYRPYGLDCSGFVDWVFYNATDGAYVIGHGGGARMQHAYCTEISWSEALPGDLVFYPDDTHVGIVVGWDENGSILIVHCASSYYNVVITRKAGFISAGRPDIFV